MLNYMDTIELLETRAVKQYVTKTRMVKHDHVIR